MALLYGFLEDIPYDHLNILWSACNDNAGIYARNFNSTVNFLTLDNEPENFLYAMNNVTVFDRDMTQDYDFWAWMSYLSPVVLKVPDGSSDNIVPLAEYIYPDTEYLIINICGVPLYAYTTDNETLYITTPGAKPKLLNDFWIGVCFTDSIANPVFSHCYDTTVCYIPKKYKQNDIIKVYWQPEVWPEIDVWKANIGYWEFVNSRLFDSLIPCDMEIVRITEKNIDPVVQTSKRYVNQLVKKKLHTKRQLKSIKKIDLELYIEKNEQLNINNIRNVHKLAFTKNNTQRILTYNDFKSEFDIERNIYRNCNLIKYTLRNIVVNDNLNCNIQRIVKLTIEKYIDLKRKLKRGPMTKKIKIVKLEVVSAKLIYEFERIVRSHRKPRIGFVFNINYRLKS